MRRLQLDQQQEQVSANDRLGRSLTNRGSQLTTILMGLSVGVFAACGGQSSTALEGHSIANQGPGGSNAAASSSIGGQSANAFGNESAARASGGGAADAYPIDSTFDTPNCTLTEDQATITAFRGGIRVETKNYESSELTVEGRVESVTPDTLVVNGCTPGTDTPCNVEQVTITASAVGLDLTTAIATGALVAVHYVEQCPWGCTTDVAVESLATWKGQTNPSPAASGLYFAVNEGGSDAMQRVSVVPYQLEKVKLTCKSTLSLPQCSDSGLYLLRFTTKSAGNQVDVPMGETRELRTGNGRLKIRNLRSFQQCKTDSSWDYGYWVVNI